MVVSVEVCRQGRKKLKTYTIFMEGGFEELLSNPNKIARGKFYSRHTVHILYILNQAFKSRFILIKRILLWLSAHFYIAIKRPC